MATQSKFFADIGLETGQDLLVDGNATVTGNLTVNGTQTTVNSTTTSVADSMIELANSNTGSDTLDIGIYGNYNDGLADGVGEFTGLFRDASDSTWKLFDGLEVEPTTTVNISGTNYAKAALEVGDLSCTTLTATNSLTGASLTYPTSDGTNGQVLTTNGSGTLSFSTISGYTDSDVESYLNSETRLGIGTSSPSENALLTFHSASSNPGFNITTDQDSNTPLAQIGYSSGSGYFLRLGDASNNEDVMIRTYGDTVFNGGNVGIGTDSPSNLLHVNGSGDALKVGNGTRHLFVASDSGGVSLGNGAGQTGEFLYLNESGGEIRLYTDGSQVLTVDSSGRTGLSQAYSPSHVLDIKNNSATTTPLVRVWNSNSNWAAKASINFLTDISDTSNYPEGNISLYRGTSSNADSGMEFSAGTSSQTVRLKYHATKSEVLINQAASFGTGSSASLIVGNQGSETTMRVMGPNTNDFNLITFYNAGYNAIGTIKNDNNTGVTYESASDYRLKENYNYDWDATTVLKQLRPLKFNWIADENDTVVEGFLAHEVQEVMPHLVSGAKDAVRDIINSQDEDGNDIIEGTTIDPQTLDYSRLVPLLVKTIQELEARITTLESA